MVAAPGRVVDTWRTALRHPGETARAAGRNRPGSSPARIYCRGMSDTCGIDDARIILPDLIEQVRALGRPVVLTDGDQEAVAALVPAGWLDTAAEPSA